MAYADHAAKMDAEVDARLGDSIFYQLPTDIGPVAKTGRILFETPPEGYVPLDSAKGKTFMQLSKVQLPTKPSKTDRVTSPLLAGTWRPMNVQGEHIGGRYWLAELQKV